MCRQNLVATKKLKKMFWKKDNFVCRKLELDDYGNTDLATIH